MPICCGFIHLDYISNNSQGTLHHTQSQPRHLLIRLSAYCFRKVSFWLLTNSSPLPLFAWHSHSSDTPTDSALIIKLPICTNDTLFPLLLSSYSHQQIPLFNPSTPPLPPPILPFNFTLDALHSGQSAYQPIHLWDEEKARASGRKPFVVAVTMCKLFMGCTRSQYWTESLELWGRNSTSLCHCFLQHAYSYNYWPFITVRDIL